MASFKVRKLKNELFEILGLDKYVESAIARFARKSVKRAAKPAQVKRPALDTPLDLIEKALTKHPHRKQLLQGGVQKDQLLRSLVPLYLARSLDVEVNSGIISRFWKLHGVRYATPNAAKALREHVGYARIKGNGRQITPNGIRYVEDELLKRRAA
jgi:hypothetical protein